MRAWGPVTNPTARALASWLCALWGRHEGARGGRLLPGCGASGVGRSPVPDCPPSGRAAGAHYPLAVGAGGCGRGDPSPTPQRALLRAGFARCGGGTRAPGGGASCLGVGRPGAGALQPPTARPLGGLQGPTTHWLWVRGGAGVGTRHQPHSARSYVLWGRHEGAQGGAPPAWVWGVRGRALSHPRLPALWAGCRGPLPTGCRCKGCGRGDPSPTLQRALLRAGFARCGGGTRAPGGGTSCLGVGRPGSGALQPPTARPLGGLQGPTTHWLWVRGGAGVGTRHQPHSARSYVLWERHEGAQGGAPPAWVWGVRGRALSHPRLPALWAGCRGPLPTGCRCKGCGRGDPSPTLQRALLRAGFARCGGGTRASGGGRLLPRRGASGVGRSPTPDCPPSGRAAGVHYPLAVGARDAGVGTRHQPYSARSCVLALRAVGAARGRLGGAPPAWVWGVRGRALSNPRLPAPWAGCRGPLPTGCGCGGMRVWGPVTNPTARALACCGGGMRAPRGGHLLPGCGASGVGRSPTPDCPPSGRAAGVQYPLAVGVRGAGVGTRHQPYSARSCELALRAVGAAQGRPGGGRLLPRCGASGVWRSPTPDCPPSGRAARAHYPLAVGAGGCGRGDPSPAPQRALLRAGFARCGGGTRAPGGGASCLGVGRPGSGALPPPTARPLSGLLGPTTHWLWVRGGCGCGDPSPTPQRAFLRAVGAA